MKCKLVRQMYLQKGYINWRPFIIKMLAR